MNARSIIDQLLEAKANFGKLSYAQVLDIIFSKDAQPKVKLIRSKMELPQNILLALAQDDCAGLRQVLANSSRWLSPQVLEVLAKNFSYDSAEREDEDDAIFARECVADRRWPLPASVARILAKDSNAEVRSSLAGNDYQNLPEDVLLTLAKDEDESVRELSIPCLYSVLSVLVKDSNVDIRFKIAELEQKLPEDVLYALARDDNADVRFELTHRPDLYKYPNVLRRIAQDTTPKIRKKAAEILSKIEADNKTKQDYLRYRHRNR
jgi:hypothetical protein